MSPPRKNSGQRKKARPKGPSEIAPGVFVGGWNDALGFEGTRFCVLDEAPDDMPPATHIRILNEDETGPNRPNLDRLVRGMRTARAKGEPVLVFCGHGIRRSPLGGAWYLRTELGVSLDAAFDRIAEVRPRVERPREWLPGAASLD